MKVAVSIPDQIFEAAERLAKQRCVPRSQVFAEALAAYLEMRGGEAVTELLNQLYDSESSRIDEGLEQAQFNSLSHEAW